ncbi:hypothetical protein [Caballeronia insecticola]|uniref:Uncharacterized protein n=1 Tax=Caballeronia insecticola TaxID=758793 RepID=R4X4V7_9BURK|nr:hypothetical protein [Caballeronia insecticola]BAN27642.1 uncharacterized protein BRPE64_DCDS07060 [Caballeronia insecticola]
MTTLTITDLPRASTLQRDAMSTVRGGIAYLKKPDSEPSFPGLPTSGAIAAILKDFHIPLSWPSQTAPAAQDPRLL